MASDFQLIPTANPLEFQIAITVPDRAVNNALALQPLGPFLAEYTEYNKFSWAATPPRVEEFGHYRYCFSEKASADATRFYFSRPHTAKEKNTPFKRIPSTRHYVWPAVLLDFYIIESSFPITTATGVATLDSATRYMPRFRYIPTTPYDSEILIEQFLSDTPWSSEELVHPQPIPTDIDGSYLGVKMSFPRCLHRRVTFPELVPGAQIIFGAGMEGSGRNGTPREQIFPTTNMAAWQEFYIEDVVQPQRGMFLRERILIKPPPRGEAIQF